MRNWNPAYLFFFGADPRSMCRLSLNVPPNNVTIIVMYTSVREQHDCRFQNIKRPIQPVRASMPLRAFRSMFRGVLAQIGVRCQKLTPVKVAEN